MTDWNDKPAGDWEASPLPTRTNKIQLADVLIYIIGISCTIGLLNWPGFLPQPTIQIQVQEIHK